MTQANQAEQAIDHLLLAGTIKEKDLATFLQAYYKNISDSISPEAPALMLVEEQPRRVIEQHARQDLLQFTSFDPNFDFTHYPSGRVFHPLSELRWERQHSKIQLVYTGHKKFKLGLQDAREIALDVYFPKDRAYFLFGKRLDKEELDLIGPAARSGDFAEVRIPRLLRYPQLATLAGAERVQLVVCEYRDQATALNFAYRFKSLVPFRQQAETAGAQKA